MSDAMPVTDPDVALRGLVALLRGLAQYNDKGYMWCHHGQAEQDAERARAREGRCSSRRRPRRVSCLEEWQKQWKP